MGKSKTQRPFSRSLPRTGCNEQIYNQIHQIAESKGQSMAEVIRTMLDAALQQKAKTEAAEYTFLQAAREKVDHHA